MFKTGPLYLANLNSNAEIVINQGGTSSGKTYSLCQTLISLAISQANKIITIVGQDIPNLKRGALRDMQQIINDSKECKSLLQSYNATDRIFKFYSGSQIEFVSYANAQDAKGGRRDYLYINECNGISWDIFVELAMMGRTRVRTFLDYNPNYEFWVHENLLQRNDIQLIISDHRHNPFLSDEQHRKIEALKDIDIDLWKVYARGMTGKLEGLIFRNWSLIDEVPKDSKYVGSGLDFGFTNDPSAFIEVFMQEGKLIVNELLYDHGLTNQDIVNRLNGLKIEKHRGIVADSAEPKSIEEIRRLGWQIEGAEKGKDSINISIQGIKNYELLITKHSTNLRKELMSYRWKTDKATGKSLNEPVDAFDHCISALRYVYLNKLMVKPSASKSYTPDRGW